MEADRWTSRWQPSATPGAKQEHASDRNGSARREQTDRRTSSVRQGPSTAPGIRSAADQSTRWGRRIDPAEDGAATGSPIADRPAAGAHWDQYNSRREQQQQPEQRRGQPLAHDRGGGREQSQQYARGPPQGNPHRRQYPQRGAPGRGEHVGPRAGAEASTPLDPDLLGDPFSEFDPDEEPSADGIEPRTSLVSSIALRAAAGGGPRYSALISPAGDAAGPQHNGTAAASGGSGSGADGGSAGSRPRREEGLASLERSVGRGEQQVWSLERLAEAVRQLCHALPPLDELDAAPQRPAASRSPLTPRLRALMDALAAAAVAQCADHLQRPNIVFASSPATATTPHAAQAGWAVAQLLWACGRAQYWDGPPQNAGLCNSPVASSVDAAASSVQRRTAPEDAPGAPEEEWPSLAELRVSNDPGTGTAAVAAASAPADAPYDRSGSTAGTHPGGGAWRPLAVALLQLLSADGCRLCGELDARSVAMVWWALARAAAAARFAQRPIPSRITLAAHAQLAVAEGGGGAGGAGGSAAAAAAALDAVSLALTAALERRAAAVLGSAGVTQLSTLLYAAAVLAGPGGGRGRVPEALLAALADEVAARLERCVVLGTIYAGGGGGGGGGDGEGGGSFTPRDLSCIAYSAGLLGLGHGRLVEAMAEFVVEAREQLKWSASSLSVFLFGLAHCGPPGAPPPEPLLRWAVTRITSLPPPAFNCRNISFLLTHFHRTRCWGSVAAATEHLLSAALSHPPPAVPLLSIATLLMCMGAGRVRHEAALAHLCGALVGHPPGELSPKDVCVCLTALQRLHGEHVLVSQLPETLAGVEHLAAAIAELGFSRGGEAGPGGVRSPLLPVFNHQEVSNAVFALGKLRFYSPAVLAALEDHAARGGLAGASAWDCTAILAGLAVLNYTVPRGPVGSERRGGGGSGTGAVAAAGAASAAGAEVDLVGLLVDVVASKARGAKSQDLANTLWALATLEGALERYRSGVTLLVEEVNRRGAQGFNVDEQRQIWQVHRELSELPAPYAAICEDLVRLGRLGMSEADHTYSRVQATFQGLLVSMHGSRRFPRLRHLQFEQQLVPGGEQMMKIDVQAIIERPGPGGSASQHRVAVEFDGPFHFMVNPPFTARIDGRTAHRNRILTRHLGPGNVVCVSMAEWVDASREPTVGGMPGRWRLLARKLGLLEG